MIVAMIRRAPLVAAALLAIAAGAGPASAHDFNPGVLALAEREPGRFDLAWSAPVDSTGSPAEVDVVLPRHCRRQANRIDCGLAGLAGDVWFTGMDLERMQVVVVVTWRGGAGEEHVVSGAEPRVRLGPPARVGWAGAVAAGARATATLPPLALLVAALAALGRGRRRGARAALLVGPPVGLAAATWLALPPVALGAVAGAAAALLARAALTGVGLGRAPAATAAVAGILAGAAASGAAEPVAAAVGALMVAAAITVAAAVAPSVLDRFGGAARADRRVLELAGALGVAALAGHALAALSGG